MKRTLVALAAASAIASLALHAPLFAADSSTADPAVKPPASSAAAGHQADKPTTATVNKAADTKPAAGKAVTNKLAPSKAFANKPMSNKPAANKSAMNKPAAHKSEPAKPAAPQGSMAPSDTKPATTMPKQ